VCIQDAECETAPALVLLRLPAESRRRVPEPQAVWRPAGGGSAARLWGERPVLPAGETRTRRGYA
ncbi:ferrochelatase, mitochondrial, partial [Clarias magur]